MNFAMYSGLVVVLLLSVLFLGPGLFSERTDYPIITWAKRKLRESREKKAIPGATATETVTKSDASSTPS
ncbi:MAG TPA: hypothetical protein VK013_15165 [Myxococcaceae bacterium]|nr:hypothetical protein [Myxococcaceae bacterium]